jgi:hypothetical protein
VAVSTKGLQIGRVVVPTVTVDMVHVELTDVYRLKVTVLAIIFLMNCVRVSVLVNGFLVDSLTLVASTEGCCFRISKFDFGRATD